MRVIDYKSSKYSFSVIKLKLDDEVKTNGNLWNE